MVVGDEDKLRTISASNAVAVTPDDAVNIAVGGVEIVTRALYIGVAGDVTVIMAGAGGTVLFTAVPVGILPIKVTRVDATNTSATNITALY